MWLNRQAHEHGGSSLRRRSLNSRLCQTRCPQAQTRKRLCFCNQNERLFAVRFASLARSQPARHQLGHMSSADGRTYTQLQLSLTLVAGPLISSIDMKKLVSAAGGSAGRKQGQQKVETRKPIFFLIIYFNLHISRQL